MLSPMIQGTVQCHKENVEILRTSTLTGDMSTTASYVLADRIISDVIHPLIVADAILHLLEQMTRIPKSKYIRGFEHRLQFHYFQTMQTLGVLDNE